MSVAALLLAMQATTGVANPAGIEQLLPHRDERPARRLPTGPDKPAQAATISQLPTNLEPNASANEEALAQPDAPTAPANRAASEVARAVAIIRGRGQQVTPELLAREVGADVLDVYLAQPNPVAIALPMAVPTPVSPPGVTVIPSQGPKQ